MENLKKDKIEKQTETQNTKTLKTSKQKTFSNK